MRWLPRSLTITVADEKLPYSAADGGSAPPGGIGPPGSTPAPPPLLRLRGLRHRRWLGVLLGVLVVLALMAATGRLEVGTPTTDESPDLSPEAVAAWGVREPTKARLGLGGRLSPWPPRPTALADGAAPLSALGAEADLVYNPGPVGRDAYAAQLREFANVFPPARRRDLHAGIDLYLPQQPEMAAAAQPRAWDAAKNIWQTDKDGGTRETPNVRSWRDGKAQAEGWDWTLMTDADAWRWAREMLAPGPVWELWKSLPTGILRADLLRYLALLIHGGIYSDTDTHLLKPPSRWGAGARAWRDGEGWMSSAQRARVAAGEDLDAVLGRPSVVVSIEADVGDNRKDWARWWPRPIQVVQWTMAAAPAHPIALQAVLRVLHATADAAQWAKTRAAAPPDTATPPTVLSTPEDGGPVGILDWTGPGVWTDSVLAYLRAQYGVRWTDLRGLDAPVRIGDVVVLPVTGFSPGVGQFGAGNVHDPLAMVWHQFRGSWRADGDKQKHPMMQIAVD